MVLSPHVIEHLNAFIRNENATAVDLEYGMIGPVYRLVLIGPDGETTGSGRGSVNPQLGEAADAFVDSIGRDPSGGTVRYVPEETGHGK